MRARPRRRPANRMTAPQKAQRVFGYSAAFLALTAAAAVALTVFALGMPETADRAAASLPS
jgi:hypothetical protein